MDDNRASSLYMALTKSIAYAAGIIIFLWFLFKIAGMVMLLLLAIILAIVINAPVTWLEKKRIKRGWGSLIVFAVIFMVIGLLAWLIIPKISSEVTSLLNNLPSYASQLSKNFASWFSNYPEINKELQKSEYSLLELIPSIPNALVRVGNYSLTIIGATLVTIVLISMVGYMVVQPRPLVELYLSFFAASQRDKATRALTKTSIMLIGWLRSNIIGGFIQATAATIFLKCMNVPGAWVWGGIAFLAQLIPKLGFFIMAIPPILVALAISPTTALWTTIFFFALDEVLGDFVMPKIRSNTMKIHPASILFLVLAVTSAFGLIGAILATPLAAFIKAFFEEFYVSRHDTDTNIETRIDTILYRTNVK